MYPFITVIVVLTFIILHFKFIFKYLKYYNYKNVKYLKLIIN